MIREVLPILVAGQDISITRISEVMNEIMEGQAMPSQVASFLTALRIKGESPEEITAMAKIMIQKSVKVDDSSSTIDTCGTGGDGKGTFNISTATAFVIAGAGLPVAKHGGRASSSNCGSADVLEKLGVNIELGPEDVKRSISEIGIGFMFAPIFHPAMKHVGSIRREIGFRSVFNILGPLTNPAGSKRQLLGVGDKSLGAKMATVLQMLGSERSMVVHGDDGLDELTLTGKTNVWELRDNEIISYALDPTDFGLSLASIDTILGGSPEHNAFIIRRVLMGERGSHRDIVLWNSAAALMVGDKTRSIEEGLELAEESIDSGQAVSKLESLSQFGQSVEYY